VLVGCVVLVLTLVVHPAWGWIENHVKASDARIVIDRAGQAEIEHRFTLRTNGNVRQKQFVVRGVDADAEPLGNNYVVPARDALSNSLDSALPLLVEAKPATSKEPAETATLHLTVDDKRGLRRGSYVFVVRYRTDLHARDLLKHDGSMIRLSWNGPVWDDGFDNTRATFVLPSAATAPRAVEPSSDEAHDALAPAILSEVRRGQFDEVELLRTYAREKESVLWEIRIDPRVLEPLPKALSSQVDEPPSAPPTIEALRLPDEWLLGGASALFLLFTTLVALKARFTRRRAHAAKATMPACLPLPTWLRAPLAGGALSGGVAFQLLWGEPLAGALAVVAATLLAAHRGARLDVRHSMRGPGRWLSISEDEAWRALARPPGSLLDASSVRGRLFLAVLLAGVGIGCYFAARLSSFHATLIGLDAVALLSLFGTGNARALPPDMSVEPAFFLRKLVKRLRRLDRAGELRLSPRIRIPNGEVDPDEMRLLIAPRLPLRGFTAIEVGVTYALGLTTRVTMPEILVRTVEGSECDRALAAVSRHGRITPGRKPEERVIAISPRLPTIRMTAQIAAALATRVADADARPASKRVRPVTRQRAA